MLSVELYIQNMYVHIHIKLKSVIFVFVLMYFNSDYRIILIFSSSLYILNMVSVIVRRALYGNTFLKITGPIFKNSWKMPNFRKIIPFASFVWLKSN